MSDVNFIAYDSTGTILRNGTCSEDLLDRQARSIETVIESDASYLTHYVMNGVVSEYTPQELLEKSDMPPGVIWQMPERIAVDMRSLETHKLVRLDSINKQCGALLNQITAGYPADEMQSWSKQEGEARAGGGPLIDALAAARGVTLTDLIGRIIAKADAFAVASGQLIGTRQRCEDQIKAATTISAVEAITWGDA